MKKFLIIMLVIIGVYANISFASVGTKEETLYYTGITLNIDNEKIIPTDVDGFVVDPFIIDGTTYLPVRAISEALGKEVSWDASTYSVHIKDSDNSKSGATYSGDRTPREYQKNATLNYNNISIYINEKQIEPKDVSGNIVEPFIIDGTTYLPVRAVAQAFEKNVDWNGESKTVFITSVNKIANVKGVAIKIINDVVCTEILSDMPINTYKYYSLEEPNRLIIDLKDTDFAIDKTTQKINYDVIKQIRFGTQDGNVSRIVLDVDEFDKYTVVQNDDRTITYLALSENFELPTGDSKKDVLVASIGDKIYIPKDEDNDTSIDTPSGDTPSNEESGDTINGEDKPNENDDTQIKKDLATVDSIKYSPSNNKTKISITGKYDYNVFTLANPNRIIVDIKNAKLNVDVKDAISPNNKNISSIRFSQNDEEVVRIVFDVNSECDYTVTEKKGELSIEIEQTSYQNIEYVNKGTYATLILRDTDIKYFDTEKTTSNKYYITYSSRKFKSGTGTIETKDEFAEEITIKSNKITIYGEKNINYTIKQNGDDVVVTLKQKSESQKKIILVDAGHGGKDPGACNGTTYEKEYTLKIALKLYEMLQDTDNIEVRISRDDDTYIDREGRRDFQLENDDADLFVSVHINSLGNKNYKGTMVLFYDKPNEKEDYGITSKELATLVKDNIVKATDMIDRGVVSRNDIWVLEQNASGRIASDAGESRPVTNLPAILCEVCFISNDEEAARLKTDKFQQDVAQAIYDGVMEAIEVMDD